MNRVAVVSCYFIHNYGSILQAYATEKYLRNIGIDCKTVRIDGLTHLLWQKKKEYYKKNKTDFSLIVSKLPLIKLKIFEKINLHNLGTEKDEQVKSFDSFRKRFSLTVEAPSSFDELTALSAEFDTVLLGGDQLWRPDNIYPCYYTLEWVAEKTKRVSLATSFGVSSLDSESTKHAAKFLPTFSGISVREKNGCDIVQNICEKEALQACDPVFLLRCDEWTGIADETVCPKEKYALCYFLGNGRNKIKKINQMCREKGLKTVVIPNLDRYEPAVKNVSVLNASPEQFLGLIKNAEYIFTDSFHCTAFSVIFGKRFLVFRRFGKKKHGTDSRIVSFLNTAGLKFRLAQSDEPDMIFSMPDEVISADNNALLQNEITKTKDFLRAHLIAEEKVNV